MAAMHMRPRGAMRRLARDETGNTLAMIGAALLPLMAMVGGSIDMGRSYMSQSRLQQACDSGVLAARKRLGSESLLDGTVPADAAAVGQRFFNVNFTDGAFGTNDRTFNMVLEEDLAITGTASVSVPTTLMQMFGIDEVNIDVSCQAQLNMSNTDVMFVLDTTGSMNSTNPGDTESRIESLRNVVSAFVNNVKNKNSNGARMRFGFVPYSANVNVGHLLKSDWMVDEWNYETRIARREGHPQVEKRIELTAENVISGARLVKSPYYLSELGAGCPSDDLVTERTPNVTAANGRGYSYTETLNGSSYTCEQADGRTRVIETEYRDYKVEKIYDEKNIVISPIKYDYSSRTIDTTFIKNRNGDAPSLVWASMRANTHDPRVRSEYWYTGCIEERDTYTIPTTGAVDFNQALDLDIDRVPDPSNPATQWRPQIAALSFVRSLYWTGFGPYTPEPVLGTDAEFVQPQYMSGGEVCPARAQKLREWNEGDLEEYLESIEAEGPTYHDIGMIWGARLLSPNGLFAAENRDDPLAPTGRHIIFLTDGMTQALDWGSGAYGVEPLSRRRWSPDSGVSLNETVERRFSVACEEAKKRNVTVWVIGFGTALNPAMTECAGPGHYFVASDNAELNTVFSSIAKKLQELRITA